MRWTNGDFALQLEKLKTCSGGQLQSVRTYAQGLELQFWSAELGKSIWFFDLSPKSPGFYIVPQNQKLKLKAQKLPLELFLNSNFKNHRLVRVNWDKSFGRVFQLHFAGDRSLEFRLFPHGVNISARTLEKSLHLHKPKPLTELDSFIDDAPTFAGTHTDEQIFLDLFTNSKGKKSAPKESAAEEKLKKLNQLLKKMQSDLGGDKAAGWSEKALALQGDPKSIEWPDPKQNLAWNIDFCFQKSKQEKEKEHRRLQRIEDIQRQIQSLKENPDQEIIQSRLNRGDLFQKSSSQGNAVRLSSGHRLLIGKNATDNMKLLRASSAWDYWLHVRDLPGSHAFLLRNKNEAITDKILSEAALELLKFSFRRNPEKYQDQKFDVILTETRFVKPIKGDKLGRVNYSQERTLRIRFE